MAITIPNTFTAHTRAVASQVNANFTAIANKALDKTGDTMTGNLLFTDALYDIGATGATRPRDFFLSRNAVIGGTVGVSGLTTLAGAQFADTVVQRPEIKDYSETTSAPTISGNALTLDCESGNTFRVALNANISTLTLSNPSATGKLCSIVLVFTADGTLRTITWPASVKWPGAAAPTMTSTNNKIDVFTLMTVDAGTSWLAFIAGQNM